MRQPAPVRPLGAISGITPDDQRGGSEWILWPCSGKS